MYIYLNQITLIYILVTKDVGTIKFCLKLLKIVRGGGVQLI